MTVKPQQIVDQLIARGIEVDVVEPDVAPSAGLVSLVGNVSMMNGEQTIIRHPFDPPFAAIIKGVTDLDAQPLYAMGYNGASAIYALETKLTTAMRDGRCIRVEGLGWFTLDKNGALCTPQDYWRTEMARSSAPHPS